MSEESEQGLSHITRSWAGNSTAKEYVIIQHLSLLFKIKPHDLSAGDLLG